MTEHSIIEIIWFVTIAVIGLTEFVVIVFQRRTLKHYETVLSKAFKSLEYTSEESDAAMKYCLTHIMNMAAEKEDFETAKKCKTLIDNINVREQEKSKK